MMETNQEFVHKELDYYKPIKELSTNQCLRIAVEAINFYKKIDKRTMTYKQWQLLAPQLCALCAEAIKQTKEQSDASI